MTSHIYPQEGLALILTPKADKRKPDRPQSKEVLTMTIEKYNYLVQHENHKAAEGINDLYREMFELHQQGKYDKVLRKYRSVQSIFWINCFA